jgi:hydroxyacylglutathione hydrolase
MPGHQITRIPILPMGMVNAFIVRTSSGCILVDAGLPDSEEKVAKALRGLGLGFGDIRLIVVTHGHIDHAGNAARLRELSGAPVIIHEAEAKYCAREEPMTFCPTGPFGRFFLRTGLPKADYKGFKPEITLTGNDAFQLKEFGLEGEIVPTPGHTPGSISVNLSNGQALVGDMLASGILLGGIALISRAKRPPFEEKPEIVADELEAQLKRNVGTFHLGHGGPLPAAEVRRHITRLRKLAA